MNIYIYQVDTIKAMMKFCLCDMDSNATKGLTIDVHHSSYRGYKVVQCSRSNLLPTTRLPLPKNHFNWIVVVGNAEMNGHEISYNV